MTPRGAQSLVRRQEGCSSRASAHTEKRKRTERHSSPARNTPGTREALIVANQRLRMVPLLELRNSQSPGPSPRACSQALHKGGSNVRREKKRRRLKSDRGFDLHSNSRRHVLGKSTHHRQQPPLPLPHHLAKGIRHHVPKAAWDHAQAATALVEGQIRGTLGECLVCPAASKNQTRGSKRGARVAAAMSATTTVVTFAAKRVAAGMGDQKRTGQPMAAITNHYSPRGRCRT